MTLLTVNAHRAKQVAIAFPAAWVGTTALAIAEVCDKERPNWTGDRVSWLAEAAWLTMNPVSMICIALACLAAMLAPRKIYALASLPLLLMSAAIFADRISPTYITQSAIREGCIGEPYLALAFFMIFAVLPFRAFWSKPT